MCELIRLLKTITELLEMEDLSNFFGTPTYCGKFDDAGAIVKGSAHLERSFRILLDVSVCHHVRIRFSIILSKFH